MERKSDVKEVHKIIPKDIAELYNQVSKILGPENPFAKIRIGSGYYLWSDSRCDWHQMISADDFQQMMVKDALEKKKQQIAAKIGQSSADSLFTVPDDSYIYYNDDAGEVKILLAGWGFKKPVRVKVGPEAATLKRHTPVNISFSFDGVKLPMYEFGVQIPKQIKRLKTDSTGFYRFGNLTQPELTLKDFPSGKDFILVVEEGRTDYDFDVTTYTDLHVNATEDGNPIVGEKVSIIFHGKNYEVDTDADGHASLQIPLHINETLTANLRNESRTVTISRDNNVIEFAFETPVVKVSTDIEVAVVEDGYPAPDKAVTINYAGSRYDGYTDENGIFTLHTDIQEGETCYVDVEDYDSQSKVLQNIPVNVFRFEKTVEKEDDPVSFAPHILIKREDNTVVNNHPIRVEYEGVSTDYISDENGIVQLPEMEEGKTMKVVDRNNYSNTAEYTLDADQDEYIFQISAEQDVKIKVMLRDAKGKPIKCDRVRFVQENADDVTASLDDKGDTYFALDTFKPNVPITVSILGAAKNYDPFKFSIEKDEKEYLLQEKNFNSWLNILLQIILVLASIIAFYYLWPVFERLFAMTFNAVYN